MRDWRLVVLGAAFIIVAITSIVLVAQTPGVQIVQGLCNGVTLGAGLSFLQHGMS